MHKKAAPEYHGTGDQNPEKIPGGTLMCGNNNGICGCLNNNWWWIIILVLLFCNCGGGCGATPYGGNGCGNGCGNTWDNNCGCGC